MSSILPIVTYDDMFGEIGGIDKIELCGIMDV